MTSVVSENGKKVLTMDVREKLVEILQDEKNPVWRWFPNNASMMQLTDYLIANGVTVQKWISVKDKLPEIVSIHKGYRSTVKKSIRVLCVCVQKSGKTMVKEGYCEWYNDYQEPRWQIPGTIDEVTHWQYLPQPPKGE